MVGMLRCASVLVLLLGLLPGRSLADRRLALVQLGERDDATAGWRVCTTREGITLEEREVPGSAFREYRAVVELTVDPLRAADEAWAVLREGDRDNLKHREILRESKSELLIYDRIRAPVVYDRDYTIRIRRLDDPVRRRTQFWVETANELGPPPARSHVRIPVISARWVIEPARHGGTRLTNYAYSEPGGAVAAFLVRGAQADRSLLGVLRMILRLRRLAGEGPAR
jgi:hypothetical protein